MNFARLDHSPRLQKTLAALSERYWRTTWEIAQETKSVAVHTDITELRANGIGVDRTMLRDTDSGRKVHAYRLAPKPVPTTQGELF